MSLELPRGTTVEGDPAQAKILVGTAQFNVILRRWECYTQLLLAAVDFLPVD
jgi:hypothetical protein